MTVDPRQTLGITTTRVRHGCTALSLPLQYIMDDSLPPASFTQIMFVVLYSSVVPLASPAGVLGGAV